jgi:hypothetical protein
MTTPEERAYALHRSSADRVYEVDDPPAIRELFQFLGFRHIPATRDSLYSDRWTHDGPQGRTVLTLFRSGRLTLLGPALPQIDALTIEPIEVGR